MLGLMREFICSVARHVGFTEKHVAEIEISVDEACANAMEHAYAAGPGPNEEGEKSLHVEIQYTGEEMVVRITDHGHGTSTMPDCIQEVEAYLDTAREQYRGLGFLLMQRFMDRVEVRSSPGCGTTVEMTKILPR